MAFLRACAALRVRWWQIGLGWGITWYLNVNAKPRDALVKKIGLKAIWLAVLGVLAIWAGYYYFLYQGLALPLDSDGQMKGVRSGTFGDAFGVINALFSALAFTGVMLTLYFQRLDIKDSRAETLRQQVESQFYSMLTLQQQVITGFDLHSVRLKGPVTYEGRDCFRRWQMKMRGHYQALGGSDDATDVVSDMKLLNSAYARVLSDHLGDLGLYFRSLYAVFRFLENSNHSDKKSLGLVVRSLLSDYELVFLFYNCFSKKGRSFTKFANEYALFDNLDVELLFNKRQVAFIEKSALGGNEEGIRIWKAERSAMPTL
ncbi:putative phage abortive infection protein [Pseudomonas syringae]|uniref:putative phage abortive infection protein n=1 Tax=Pseudomonas syringae TaxID=317 RepID=UPI003F75B2B3